MNDLTLNLEHYPYSKDQVKYILSLCLVSGLSFNEIQNRLVPTPIKMPKFFDDWAKAYNTYTDSGLNDALNNLFDIYTTGVYENGIEEKLNTWIQENNTSERYIQCTKALIAGYEVEK